MKKFIKKKNIGKKNLNLYTLCKLTPLPAVMIGRNSTMPFFLVLFCVSFQFSALKTEKLEKKKIITTWCCFQRPFWIWSMFEIYNHVCVCECVCSRTGDKHWATDAWHFYVLCECVCKSALCALFYKCAYM